LPGAGEQIKNQERELSLKFRTGAGAMAMIWEVDCYELRHQTATVDPQAFDVSLV